MEDAFVEKLHLYYQGTVAATRGKFEMSSEAINKRRLFESSAAVWPAVTSRDVRPCSDEYVSRLVNSSAEDAENKLRYDLLLGVQHWVKPLCRSRQKQLRKMQQSKAEWSFSPDRSREQIVVFQVLDIHALYLCICLQTRTIRTKLCENVAVSTKTFLCISGCYGCIFGEDSFSSIQAPEAIWWVGLNHRLMLYHYRYHVL